MHDHPIQQKQLDGSQAEHSSPDMEGKSLAPPAFQLMASDGSDAPPVQRKQSSGGLPGDLVNGFAASTGHDLSDVKVHSNSDKPAQVGALAYAQGNDIHLGSGQEQHLAHEAAHIVQQREGRVQANTNVGGMPVNDQASLESEADSMGAKAAQMKAAGPVQTKNVGEGSASAARQLRSADAADPAAQFVRRLRTDYPWEGIVTSPIAAIQTQPIHQCTTTDVQIASGTRLRVTGRSGQFLQVQPAIGAAGYIHESMVDDLVANQISTEMVGAQRQWYPSGPVDATHPARTDFARSAVDPAADMSTIGAHAPAGPGFAAGNNSSSL
ncbi:MAG TPA: DUF4157 domain-containing protein, partial [Bacteroidia bacterium]|nr:DUF4157 domain-containing protein [Bacteroidia bacterium]